MELLSRLGVVRVTFRFRSSVWVGANACEPAEVSCHMQENTKASGNRGRRHRKVVMGREVGGDAGEGAELGTVGGEMGRAEERRAKAVKSLMGGVMSE